MLLITLKGATENYTYMFQTDKEQSHAQTISINLSFNIEKPFTYK